MPEPIFYIADKSSIYPLTLLWPTDTKVPTIAGQWRREDGGIVAWYNDVDELEVCVLLAKAMMEEQ